MAKKETVKKVATKVTTKMASKKAVKKPEKKAGVPGKCLTCEHYRPISGKCYAKADLNDPSAKGKTIKVNTKLLKEKVDYLMSLVPFEQEDKQSKDVQAEIKICRMYIERLVTLQMTEAIVNPATCPLRN